MVDSLYYLWYKLFIDKEGGMTKKTKKYVLELTQKELEFIRDGVEFLSPDNTAAKKLQAGLLEKIDNVSPAKPSEIIISVRDGVVTHVFSTDKTAQVTVLDYDGDYADDNQKIWENEILPRENVDLFTVV
jgi:hypothetical protein